MSKNNSRNQLLNFLKGIACIGVVFIHVVFPGMIGWIVSKLAQFAVPVFFMIAGYYVYNSSEQVIKRRLIKIIKILGYGYFWFFTYNVILQLKDGTVIEWLTSQYTGKTIVKYVVFLLLILPHHFGICLQWQKHICCGSLLLKLRKKIKC